MTCPPKPVHHHYPLKLPTQTISTETTHRTSKKAYPLLPCSVSSYGFSFELRLRVKLRLQSPLLLYPCLLPPSPLALVFISARCPFSVVFLALFDPATSCAFLFFWSGGWPVEVSGRRVVQMPCHEVIWSSSYPVVGSLGHRVVFLFIRSCCLSLPFHLSVYLGGHSFIHLRLLGGRVIKSAVPHLLVRLPINSSIPDACVTSWLLSGKHSIMSVFLLSQAESCLVCSSVFARLPRSCPTQPFHL